MPDPDPSAAADDAALAEALRTSLAGAAPSSSDADAELAEALAASAAQHAEQERERADLDAALLQSSAAAAESAAAATEALELERLQLATALSESEARARTEREAADDAALLDRALRASLLEAFPPFTAVPPSVVRAISSEAEYGTPATEDGGGGEEEGECTLDLSDERLYEPRPPAVRVQTSGEVRALAAALDEEERAAREAAERGPAFECGICLEDSVPLLAGHRLGCGHTFCTPCVGEHVKVKIASREIGGEALGCPSCAAPIGISDVHALTWRCGDDASWRRFEAAGADRMIESLVRDGGARRCPSATCNYAFVWQAGDAKAFECPSCAAAFCLACPCAGGGVGPAHPGLSCAGYEEKLAADAEAKTRHEAWRAENAAADERFRELMRSEMRSGNTKPCPKCKQAITKSGGCHHHVCISCKTKFCWRCGGFNAARPSSSTCRSTCTRPEAVWWSESELLGAPAPPAGAAAGGGASSSAAAAASGLAIHPLQTLSDALRARLMAIYRGTE